MTLRRLFFFSAWWPVLLIFVVTYVSLVWSSAVTIRSHKVTAITSLAQLDGLVFNSKDGSLYFTDEQHDRIMRVRDPMKGSPPEVWRQPSGGATGMTIDLEGRLIVCESAAKRVTRIEHDGRVTILADRYTYNNKGQALRFNNPKDVVVDSKGRIYFIDSSSDAGGESLRQQDAVYRIEPDVEGRKGEHRVKRVLGNLRRADGLAVSSDESMLFVLDTHPLSNQLIAFMLMREGTPSFDRPIVLHDFGMSRGGDGICLDSKGRIYVAAGRNIPGTAPVTFEDKMYDQLEAGIYVFSRSGAALGSVAIPEDLVTDCAFGGPDMQTLFVTAGDSVYKVQVSWEETSEEGEGTMHGETPLRALGADDKDTYYKAPLPDANHRTPPGWAPQPQTRGYNNNNNNYNPPVRTPYPRGGYSGYHPRQDYGDDDVLEVEEVDTLVSEKEMREKLKEANMNFDKEEELKRREEVVKQKEEEVKKFEEGKKELEKQQRLVERALKLKQVEAERELLKKQVLAVNAANVAHKEEKAQKERLEKKQAEEKERKEKARLQAIEKKKERERLQQLELERQREEQRKEEEEALKLKLKKQKREEKVKQVRSKKAGLMHEEL